MSPRDHYDDDERGGRGGGRDYYDKYDKYDKNDKFDDTVDGKPPRRFISGSGPRKKNCRFCTDAEYVLDYKNVRVIQSFLTEHGKIVPARVSGSCALHQRKLTIEVKRARNLALVGYVSAGY